MPVHEFGGRISSLSAAIGTATLRAFHCNPHSFCSYPSPTVSIYMALCSRDPTPPRLEHWERLYAVSWNSIHPLSAGYKTPYNSAVIAICAMRCHNTVCSIPWEVIDIMASFCPHHGIWGGNYRCSEPHALSSIRACTLAAQRIWRISAACGMGPEMGEQSYMTAGDTSNSG